METIAVAASYDIFQKSIPINRGFHLNGNDRVAAIKQVFLQLFPSPLTGDFI
jgi:hypothetical protein